ncbi:ribose-5-phosphate isomerase RpiA [Bacillus sp. ISL-40]|uniref:ribose-5-phosphate isomerase RpiA n=1 Tax=unclassified Bacillus (in: firmicutes) TaxID=185979 RepID=UPI001BE74C26|nr:MULTISPECIES: ribose-5-phosphate isomerase RpiA [unclassified Bacillus (in: firmicutes)]MBT2698962.1 ribose-5-phosphate isomerase RpiA [Bacillus sp. ISL-40]MBT2721076.1 ribose-5-phosphate isomerase RpiA [Bacillus sp. ISL-46]MBT2742638.1 ribose-5-phosphate isomerase RpiA [Bacillus sp. ISL-77]
MNEKKEVGEKAVDYVKEGMVVGLGTGSTVFYTISKLGKLVQQGFSIKGIPTSKQTEKLAIDVGIPLVSLNEIDHIDLAIDGADEVNRDLDLIKGGGGALLREKIIAKAAKTLIVVTDSHKNVDTLGTFPLPIEVVPFGYEMTMKYIRELGGNPKLREKDGNPFLTDNGNYIIDSSFQEIKLPKELEKNLNLIPGVVDNGLFVGLADAVITIIDKKLVTKVRRLI